MVLGGVVCVLMHACMSRRGGQLVQRCQSLRHRVLHIPVLSSSPPYPTVPPIHMQPRSRSCRRHGARLPRRSSRWRSWRGSWRRTRRRRRSSGSTRRPPRPMPASCGSGWPKPRSGSRRGGRCLGQRRAPCLLLPLSPHTQPATASTHLAQTLPPWTSAERQRRQKVSEGGAGGGEAGAG